MKKWFSLGNVQRLANLANVRLVKFNPMRGQMVWSGDRLWVSPRVRGVHIGFQNGVTLSIQWDKVNYCDQGVTSCEVMAMDEDGNAICIPDYLTPQHYDQVIGHVDRDDLLLIIKACNSITEKIKKEVGAVEVDW